MRDIVLAVLILGTIPLILRRPYIGVLVWCVIGFLNPHRFTWGFAYDFPFAFIIAIVTLVAFLFSKEPKSIPLTPITITLILLLVWMTISTVFSLVPISAWSEWERVLKIQFMVFMTLALMQTRERIHWLALVIAFSIGFFGIKGGVFAILTAGEHRVWGPDRSFIADNNAIALALIMIMPLLRYLQLQLTNRWYRLAMTGVMGLCLLAIVSTYSRGAFLALAALGMFLVWKSRQRGFIIIGMMIALPAVVSFMPEKYFERIESIRNYEQDESALGRINAWKFAHNVAKDRPLIGGGFHVFTRDNFLIYAPHPLDFHDAHSIYFEVLGEHGFVGLGLFCLLLFLSWRAASWTIRNARRRADLKWASDLASMLQVSLVGYIVGGAFLGLAYFDLYYSLVAMIVVLKVVVQRELAVPLAETSLVFDDPDRPWLRRARGQPGGA